MTGSAWHEVRPAACRELAALAGVGESVDLGRQGLDLRGVSGAKPFRRAVPEMLELPSHALERPQPELGLHPRRAGEHEPQQQQEERELLPERPGHHATVPSPALGGRRGGQLLVPE